MSLQSETVERTKPAVSISVIKISVDFKITVPAFLLIRGRIGKRNNRQEKCQSEPSVFTGPYLRTGQRGPGPGRQISRGGILRMIEIELWYVGEKRLSTREKFKGDLY
jgi:hypothetical protein